MNEMNQLLQIMQTQTARQTTKSTQSNSKSEGPSEFEKMLQAQSGNESEPAQDQSVSGKDADKTDPAAVEDSAKTPADEPGNVLQELAAAMTAFSAVVPQIQPETVELPVEAVGETVAVSMELPVETLPQTAQQAQPVAQTVVETMGQSVPETVEAAVEPQIMQPVNRQTAETPQAENQQTAPAQDHAGVEVIRAVETSGQTQSGEQKPSMDLTQDGGMKEAEATRQTGGSDADKAMLGGAENAEPLFQKLESVPVKVGELPVADTQSGNFDGQITQQIGKALADGSQTVTIQLTPENLGTVVIDLTRTQDGALEVVLHASTEKAAGILNQHLDKLGLLLQNSTQNSVQVNVQREEQAQQFQQQDQHQGQHQQQQNQHSQNRRQSAEDFLQQLRLGLVTLDEQVS